MQRQASSEPPVCSGRDGRPWNHRSLEGLGFRGCGLDGAKARWGCYLDFEQSLGLSKPGPEQKGPNPRTCSPSARKGQILSEGQNPRCVSLSGCFSFES